jgi:hypothetical protein
VAGYDVRTAELEAAAAAGRSAAGQVGALEPGADLTAGAAGIPGAPAVGVIAQVAQRWQQAVSDWQRRAERHSQSLAAAAATYARAQDAAVGQFSHISRAL